MSRSRKKHPAWTHHSSEKYNKKRYHRDFRRKEKVAIREDAEMPDKNEVCDVWLWTKDGIGATWIAPETNEQYDKSTRK